MPLPTTHHKPGGRWHAVASHARRGEPRSRHDSIKVMAAAARLVKASKVAPGPEVPPVGPGASGSFDGAAPAGNGSHVDELFEEAFQEAISSAGGVIVQQRDCDAERTLLDKVA